MKKKCGGTTVGELARLVGGLVDGDESVLITDARSIQNAGENDITLVSGDRWAEAARQSDASALVVGQDFEREPDGAPVIRVDVPDLAFARIVERLYPPVPAPKPGIDPTAVVHDEARLGSEVSIGAGAVIEAGAIIGDRTIIHPLVYVGTETQIGSDCVIWPNVTIRERITIGSRVIIYPGAVVGSDGFGYTEANGELVKIPQLGTVVIEDDAEIGACSCIDRARFDRTYIGRNVKIDNLVQVAHNVSIGEGSIIVALVGIAGSVTIGKRCVIGGQVGFDGHVTLGDGVRVGAKSGVISDIPAGQTILGAPAQGFREQMRLFASLRHLPKLREQVKTIEKTLAKLLQENEPKP